MKVSNGKILMAVGETEIEMREIPVPANGRSKSMATGQVNVWDTAANPPRLLRSFEPVDSRAFERASRALRAADETTVTTAVRQDRGARTQIAFA